MLLTDIPQASLKSDLLKSVHACNLRGLVHSAQWLSELACSLECEDNIGIPTTEMTDVLIKEYDRYCLAKSFFDCKEFSRAAHHLQSCKSQLGIFLYFYSRYMGIEKAKRYQLVDVLDKNRPAEKYIEELTDLRNDLKRREEELDGYCFYLYGVILKALDLQDEAKENLECAVQMEPLFWGSWVELSTICKDRHALQELKVPKHWMNEFFYAHSELELHLNEEALSRYHDISSSGFETSLYVKSQIATIYYNMRDIQTEKITGPEDDLIQSDTIIKVDQIVSQLLLKLNFDSSLEIFKESQSADPYMLDHIDIYSNILYLKDSRAELSYLAHHASEVDKYRAESCGVIGNYYSLRREHDKAVIYFKQALRLNPKYISAWTLLGHEYVELRNTSAAIESYRRATEVNSRDFRAWYGLGQTYEILKMPNYSLYYFREAYKLRPNDARMLVALADTYKKIDKPNEAKKCYLRALRLGDTEFQATINLAKLFHNEGDKKEAVKYYTLFVEKANHETAHSSEDFAEAFLYLGWYYYREKMHQEAYQYATRARDFTESREEAKSLIEQITELSKTK